MFEYLDYKPIPKDLKKIILDQSEKNSSKEISRCKNFYVNERIESAVNNEYSEIKLGLGLPLIETEKISNLCSMTMFQLDEVTQWVRENITDNFNAVHIQSFENGVCFFPHVDLIRSKALNYLVLTGDADTVFYEPKKEFAHLKPMPSTFIPHDRISQIKSFKIENDRWHQLDVTKIHNVENIKSKRLAITVSFV